MFDPRSIAREWQRERVHAKRRRPVDAWLAEIVSDRPRRREQHQREIRLRIDQSGVVRHQILGAARDLGVVNTWINSDEPAASTKARKVIGPAIKTMSKGANEVGDSCAEDDTRIIERERRLQVRFELAVEKSYVFAHDGFT